MCISRMNIMVTIITSMTVMVMTTIIITMALAMMGITTIPEKGRGW